MPVEERRNIVQNHVTLLYSGDNFTHLGSVRRTTEALTTSPSERR